MLQQPVSYLLFANSYQCGQRILVLCAVKQCQLFPSSLLGFIAASLLFGFDDLLYSYLMLSHYAARRVVGTHSRWPKWSLAGTLAREVWEDSQEEQSSIYHPQRVFVETKAETKRYPEAQAQLGIWVTTWFDRVSEFRSTSDLVIPVLIATAED
ncbi:hypothetical protein E0Z10_g424 [Xylaria hypoxylon]|uniref:PD-(D/E)XK nuclease-like domain-containing protein n=1 Tax=Xylaria hypoxylon TaxID=37992 RepID=A0A4Z0Z7T9_9PEZI|nr:hypothetical protein E0Z10_g424 [Xylaria hypoxylon]